MDLISLLVLLVVCGLLAYLVETYIPLSPPFQTAVRVVVVLVVILLLLRAFGVGDLRVLR